MNQSRHHRGRPIRSIAILLLLVLLAAGCTGRRGSPSNYGATVKRNFVSGCVVTAKTTMRVATPQRRTQICACAYTALTKQVNFHKFERLNKQLSRKPGPLPSEMQRIITRCVTDTGV